MRKFIIMLLTSLFLIVPVSAEESYDYLYPFENGYARAMENLKWGLLDENLDLAVDFTWDYIGTLSENRRIIKKGDLYGFMDADNTVVVSPVYSQVYNFSEGFCAVKNAEGKWGYIDPDGILRIPCTYEVANEFSCGLALVKTETGYGYIDEMNRFVIPAEYEEAYPFSENRACVRLGEGYGYIDTSGQVVTPAGFELAFDFCGGSAVVKQESYGTVDASGTIHLMPGWDQLSPEREGNYYKGRKGELWSFVDASGVAVSDGYAYLGDFSQGLCPVKTSTGYGYIDESFALVIPAEWDSAGAFSEGFAPVSKDGLFGYIDTTGTLVTELLYAECGQVSAGWAAVCNDGNGYYFIKPDMMTASSPEEEQDIEVENEDFDTVVDGRMLLLKVDYPYLQKNGENIPMDVAPIIRDGRTLLPIRHVVEALGGQVGWSEKEKKVTLTYESHSVVMYLNEAGAFVDGRFSILDVAPISENGRTMIPIRFALESLGCEVEWLSESREILITY